MTIFLCLIKAIINTIDYLLHKLINTLVNLKEKTYPYYNNLKCHHLHHYFPFLYSHKQSQNKTKFNEINYTEN